MLFRSWSLYNNDPIFCSWFQEDDPNGDKCQPFYNASNGRDPSPWTQAQTDHVCKREGLDALESNSRNIDYWSFDPKIWFVDLYDRPYLKVTFTVNGVIHTCGTDGGDLAGSDRRLLKSNDRELLSNAVRYVSDEMVVVFGEGPDGEDETIVIKEEPAKIIHKSYMPLVIGFGVTATVFLVLLCLIGFAGRKGRYDAPVAQSVRGGLY